MCERLADDDRHPAIAGIDRAVLAIDNYWAVKPLAVR
jgi:hypothetical protein